jgi:LysM repeat protein
MAKWYFVLVITLLIGNNSYAQKLHLEISGTGANLYIEHEVAAKEGLYSIGRMYNVTPKDLATYNKLNVESGLTISQKIKIPLDKNNFTQSEKVSGDEFLVPLYHTVKAHETLFRLSVNYEKVAIASLKKWNHLTSNALSAGVPLIVGFLKVDKNQSSLVSQVQTLIPSEQTVLTPTVNLQEKVKLKEEKIKPVEVVTSLTQSDSTIVVEKKSSKDFKGGIFKELYEEQIQKVSPTKDYGVAGTFKSTSGWQDGKYYCFSNDAPSGTVLKITDNATGKSVYVKVLDNIPDIKQNEGLSLIISNSAAEELGTGDARFNCSLTYAKE